MYFFPSVLRAEKPDPRDESIFGNKAIESSSTTQPAPNSHDAQRQPVPADHKRHQPKADGFAHQDGLLKLKSDRLQIGGLMYLRFNMNFTDGDRLSDHAISTPNLVDVYLDARPNDRVRAFVRGRLLYDPTIAEDSLLSQLGGAEPLRVALNELWLKFDIYRSIYVTIGSQRVLWGTTRLWNPVDFINRSNRPVLQPFDGRNGIPMVKLHFPIETLGWNVYLVGLLDEVNSLERAGGVARAEFVFSTVELAVSGALRKGVDPRVGFDVSAGLWDFDIVGEMALSFSGDYDNNVSLQASAGLQYSSSIFDNDIMVLGLEYFFNQQGTGETNALDLFRGTRQFFYSGKHYGAAFATLPSPGSLDRWTFTVSAVGNLSDRSFVGRLDVSVEVLTHITLQMFVVNHLGKQGELRLGEGAFPNDALDTARALFSPDDPTRRIPTQLIDVGLWIRLDL